MLVAQLPRPRRVTALSRAAVGATIAFLATAALACSPSSAAPAPDAGPGASLRVLVFSATAGYRHASIPDGIAALRSLAGQRGWALSATEDATQFQDGTLSALDVIVFLSTTGDVLDTDQQGALVRYVQSGKGWVGIHSASDTEHDWPWYGGLVGTYFLSHPDIQQASIHVEDPAFPATQGLPDPWVRTDEWYAFTSNPRGHVNVLLSLDESSYSPGDSGMGGDHPIAWYQTYEGGRSFYTALGHTSESYSEPLFLAHLAAAIEWAGGR
jgi:cytochrome c